MWQVRGDGASPDKTQCKIKAVPKSPEQIGHVAGWTPAKAAMALLQPVDFLITSMQVDNIRRISTVCTDYDRSVLGVWEY